MQANNMRLGKKYYIINHGEEYKFEVIEFIGEEDYLLKDVFTFERYTYQDIIKFGKGKDFEINDL